MFNVCVFDCSGGWVVLDVWWFWWVGGFGGRLRFVSVGCLYGGWGTLGLVLLVGGRF